MAPRQANKKLSKRGAGLHNIGKLHYQPVYLQRGAGLGGFFTKLFTYLQPLAASGISALKDQALRTGKEILNDLGEKKSIKSVLKTRGREALNDLTVRGLDKLKKEVGKQRGSGYIKRQAFMNPAIIAKAIESRRRRRVHRRRPVKRKAVKTKQIGGRRRRRRRQPVKTKKRRQKRTLDIFN